MYLGQIIGEINTVSQLAIIKLVRNLSEQN